MGVLFIQFPRSEYSYDCSFQERNFGHLECIARDSKVLQYFTTLSDFVQTAEESSGVPTVVCLSTRWKEKGEE